MIMNTPMQELINWANRFKSDNGKYPNSHELIEGARLLVEKEKQMVIDAYDAGETDEGFSTSIKYYNETFKPLQH